MVAKTPAFPFYGKDAYGDELFVSLSFAAQGLWLRLAWWQWGEGSIPADVAEIVGALPAGKSKEILRLWPEVERHFPLIADGSRRQNATVETHRARIEAKRERQSRGAKTTNAARWGADPDVSLTDTSSDSLTDHIATVSGIASRGNCNDSGSGSLSQITKEQQSAPRKLSPQQEAVGMVLDAFAVDLRPHGGIVARWIAQISEGRRDPDPIAAAEVVREIVWKNPTKPPDYIAKCVGTEAVRAKAGGSHDRRTTSRPTAESPKPDRKPSPFIHRSGLDVLREVREQERLSQVRQPDPTGTDDL